MLKRAWHEILQNDCHNDERDCWFSIFYRLLDGGPDGKAIAEERLFAFAAGTWST